MHFADEWNSGSRRQELRKEFEGALRRNCNYGFEVCLGFRI